MNRVADNEPVRRRERRGTVGEDQDAAMKNGWQTKTLADLCEISSALVDPRQPKYQKLLHVGGANIESATGKLIALQTAKDEGLISGKFFFDERAVLYSKIRPYLMKVARPNFKGLCSADIYPLMPRDGLLDRGFLYYLLLTPRFTDFAIAGSARAGMPKVNREHLFAYSLAVPPLPEQRRIVGLLDEAFAGIATAQAHAEKNLQNARALFESHLQAVFTQRGKGWKQTPLAELCESSRVITYGVIKLGDEVPDGVPCLRTSNVRWLRIETEGMKRIAPSLSSEYSRTILKGREVLVNVRGTLGGVAVAAPEMAGWNVSREVAVVPVDPSRVNPAFVSYLIGSGTSQQWLGGVKKGAAYVGINIEDLRLLPVGVPGINDQIEVVHHLDSLYKEAEHLAGLYERKLAALAVLKESLLHQAFAGEL